MPKNLYSRQELEQHRGFKVKLADITFDGGEATSGDTKTDFLDVRQFKEGSFYLVGDSIAGTTKELDVKVEELIPGQADNWLALVTFTQLTADGQEKKDVAANLGAKIAVTYTCNAATTGHFEVWAVLKI